MSQEIQLSLPNSGLPQALGHMPGANGALGPVAPPQTPLAKMHALLRGRYLITVLAAGILALGGAVVPMFLLHPGYQSIGIIEIDPRIPSPELTDRIMPLWQAYVITVVENFHSDRVMHAAMMTPEWKAHRKAPPDTYIKDWNKNLVVKLVPNSFDITVTYTDDSKDGKEVAPIAVRGVINAYKELYGDQQKIELVEKKKRQTNKSGELEQRIKNCEAEINQLIRTDGEDLQKVFESKFATHAELEKELRIMTADLIQNRAELKKADERSQTTGYTVEDWVRVDVVMAEMYRVRMQVDLDYQDLAKRLGTEHPLTKAAKDKLKTRDDEMKTYGADLNKRFFIKPRIDGTGSQIVSRDLSVEEGAVIRAKELFDRQKLELDDLSSRNHKVAIARSEKARREEERRRVESKIEELIQEIDMANNLSVIDPGGQATIGSDKRVAFGAIGFLGGAGIPVGLMMLISLMNPRFRFSDEAASHQTSGMTLLGILPDLPDRLSDPEQASIAAHCVHQIRTMLQINNGTDERRVFAVTSAAPGDGKTSLTLALGLSYAACGTRTLLIDCDLIGAGLTTRMNVSATDGVLEAISHRSLLEYVRSTDIADVSILPVGSGQNLHASTLSPAALRRLIEEGKKHFDTILIDTGPVLGSIEASLVAAAADAVVLTVSRGQQRPLVEKTIQHLKNIKANLAGVVFNRAQTADFDSSISGLSLRSNSSGSGHNMRMGPVARAVQSAFKPAGEEVN